MSRESKFVVYYDTKIVESSNLWKKSIANVLNKSLK